MAENFVRSEFKLTATFSDAKSGAVKAKFDDIVSISATFALNSIPVAALVVAAGKEVQKNRDANIHKALGVLKPRDKVKVTLTVRSNDGETSLMPNGTGVIFEGYYVGTGYQRSNNAASYTLHLIHWLDDLNCSSMINGNWHPGVPHDLAQAANADVARMRGGSNIGAVPLVDPTNTIITLEHMSGDLWEQVLKPVFKEIASFSIPSEQNPAQDSDPERNGNNATAISALDRMPGNAPRPGKLPLFLEDLNAGAIEDGVRKGVSVIATENMAYSSFWSKLVGEFAPAFLFAISPCPEFVNVIPFFGGLSTHWKEIDGREYNYANFNSSVGTLIESIEIRYSAKLSSGWGNGGPVESVSYYRPWGKFPTEPKDLRGQIIVKDPPAWLANTVATGVYAAVTAGLGQRAGDTQNPPGNAQNKPAGALTPAEIEQNIADSSIIDRYCEHWYKTEVLSQRYGEISGKLRFDIAPGSIVRIKEPDFGVQDDEVTTYAAVTHVSFLINAEQHTAGTSFTLLNLRTDPENQDPDGIFTSPEPPLYPSAPWVGGPLVRGFS